MRSSFLFGVLLLLIIASTTFAQTTEFTYQGQLQNSSAPATGSFDFEFALFDSVSGGAQVGLTQTRSGVSVTNGIFSVDLDFGASFPGASRFLEIRVRQSGGGAFTPLTPRQPLSSSPYAVKSLSADSAQTAVNATNSVNATSAGTATNFTGPLVGDVTGTQTATTVARLQGRNVTSTQPNNGQVLKFNTATSQWEPANDETASGGGGGTITGVTAGTGLSGGGASGSVTVAIANGGVGTLQLADNSVTDPKIVGVSGAKVTGAVTNSLQLGGVTANQYVQTNDSRLTDARPPTPGSTNYVQNGNVQQAAANFNISGNGTVGGTLSGNTVNVATQYNINGLRVLSIPGDGNVFAGSFAGSNNTSGLANSFFGTFAGNSNTTGAGNAFFGAGSGQANTTGGGNAFFGNSTGIFSTGINNSFFGSSAGQNNTTGLNNSFFGNAAGLANTTGNANAFFGISVGNSTTTGGSNSFFGSGSGRENVSGGFNSFFGRQAGSANVSGTSNTVVGADADLGSGNLTFATVLGAGAIGAASNSVTLGRNLDTVQVPGNLNVVGTLAANINGASITNLNASNLATGTLAVARGGTGITSSGASGNFLRSNGAAWVSSGISAVDIPVGSGNYIQNQNAAPQAASDFNVSGTGTANILNAATQYNINGNRVLGVPGTGNVFVGIGSGGASSGVSNSFFGAGSGASNNGGTENSFFGRDSGSANFGGTFNSFFGRESGSSNTSGDNNSFFGRRSGDTNTTGDNNTAIGANADFGANNLSFATAIGSNSVASLSNSIYLGRSAAQDTVRIPGVVIVTGGADAEANNTSGHIIAGFTNGTNVVIDDNEIMARSPSGTSTLAINGDGGNVNLIQSGTGNVGIGTSSPADKLDVDGDIRVGTGTTGCVRDSDGTIITGTCSSDMRFKKNVRPFSPVLNRVSQLRPVSFNWRADEFPEKTFGTKDSYGLIAQEVGKVLPELVVMDEKGYAAVNYSKLPLLTIQAVKELNAQNQTLKTRLDQQAAEIAALKALVCGKNRRAKVCRKAL